MALHPCTQLIHYKQWADRGLCDLIARNLDRLDAEDTVIMLRILDHFHVVDVIFQHHLTNHKHGFQAPRSEETPDFQTLAGAIDRVDDWYVSHVETLSDTDLDQPVDFAFSNGTPARMRRSEILLHVSLHGTYHRGNAGVILQKNGVKPNDDRLTDFLESAA